MAAASVPPARVCSARWAPTAEAAAAAACNLRKLLHWGHRGPTAGSLLGTAGGWQGHLCLRVVIGGVCCVPGARVGLGAVGVCPRRWTPVPTRHHCTALQQEGPMHHATARSSQQGATWAQAGE